MVQRRRRQVGAPFPAMGIDPRGVPEPRVRLGGIDRHQRHRQRRPLGGSGGVPSADRGRGASAGRPEVRPETVARSCGHVEEREIELGQVALEISCQRRGELPYLLGTGLRRCSRHQRAARIQRLRVPGPSHAAEVGERHVPAGQREPPGAVGIVAGVGGRNRHAGVGPGPVQGRGRIVGDVNDEPVLAAGPPPRLFSGKNRKGGQANRASDPGQPCQDAHWMECSTLRARGHNM